MRSAIDFSSWHGLLSTLLGLVFVTVIAVGLRMVVMQRLQQRRERQNRQINERLKTLIAAYKTLGSSFTGTLVVDPRHARDLPELSAESGDPPDDGLPPPGGDPERRRRIRDAVEAALSDVILLGTTEQVGLAVQAARDMVDGRPVETAALVVSLRAFIREVLELEAIPGELEVPPQGPARVQASGARSAGGRSGGGGGGGGGGGLGGTGMAAGGAMGPGVNRASPDRGIRIGEPRKRGFQCGHSASGSAA